MGCSASTPQGVTIATPPATNVPTPLTQSNAQSEQGTTITAANTNLNAAAANVDPTIKENPVPANVSKTLHVEPATQPRRRGSISDKIAPRRYSVGGTLLKREPPSQELLRDLLPAKMPVSAHIILGKWKCTEVSKNYESYLIDLGFPWIFRKVAVPFAKSTIVFYVKSFSDDEVKSFDRFLSHTDGNPLLGCKYKMGPKFMEEPLPGFIEPALVGMKIKEEIRRWFDGDTLVTTRDWSVLQNLRPSFKPVPTEMRVMVFPGAPGISRDTLREEVVWGDGKKYHRSFERVDMELWDCFQGSAPKRPAGKYYVWTPSGIKFAAKTFGNKEKDMKNFGFVAGYGCHISGANRIWSETGGGDPSQGYDWARMCKEGYIEEVPVDGVPPSLPEEPKYVVKAALVGFVGEHFTAMGCSKNEAGKYAVCEGFLCIIEGDALLEETFKYLYIMNKDKFASPDAMLDCGFIALKATEGKAYKEHTV
jgi:hypothetical protein